MDRFNVNDTRWDIYFQDVTALAQYNVIRCYINLFTHDKQMVYCKLYFF